MQICTSPQTDNHAGIPPLSFLQAGCPSCCPTNSVKALKVILPRTTYWTAALPGPLNWSIANDTQGRVLMHSSQINWVKLQGSRSSAQMYKSTSTSAHADGTVRQFQPLRCTQSYTSSVVIGCRQHSTSAIAVRCCQHQTDYCHCLYRTHQQCAMTKFSKSRVWDKVPEGNTLVLEIFEIR